MLETASVGAGSTVGGGGGAPHVEWLVCDANVSPEVLIDDLNTTVQVLGYLAHYCDPKSFLQ